jgi:small-conductance mechanosensitive channel
MSIDTVANVANSIRTNPEIAIELANASGLVALAVLLGIYLGRRAGPPLADWWALKAGERVSGFGPRFGDLLRYLCVSLLVGLLLEVREWTLPANLLLGLSWGIATALLVWTLTSGLRMPRWAAAILSAAAFVAALTRAINGIRSLGSILEDVSLRIGGRTFTLLDVTTLAISLLVLAAVIRLARRIISHSIARTDKLDSTQKVLAQKLAGIALLAAAFLIGIDLLGIDLTALAVFSGAVGLAIGFGLQKTFGNLIAGIILLLDRSIKPGDVISVGESFGAISKIGVRAVSIVTRDGKEHLIPNENLMTEEVVNWSYSDTKVRIHIPVGVSYDCDLALAQRLMIEAGKQPARVLPTPAPAVWLKGFGDNSVDHDILVWVADPEAGVGNVQSEVLNALWHLFKEHGVEIPFPQRDLHIRSLPDTGITPQAEATEDQGSPSP